MKPSVLIVCPDLALGSRLDQLSRSCGDVQVSFATSAEEGLVLLREQISFDLCVFYSERNLRENRIFVDGLREDFPRVLLLHLSADLEKTESVGEEGRINLSLPLDEPRFLEISRRVLTSLAGSDFFTYQVGARIASDHWGDVHEAYDTVLKRKILLTVARPWASLREVANFRATASLRAQAAHSHVEAVYVAGNHLGRDFFTHERWSAPSLVEIVAAGKKLEARQAAEMIRILCTVLVFWDSQNYAHPPIRPEDITMSPEGVVKLRNSVDPALSFEQAHVADLIPVFAAIRDLLSLKTEIPEHLLDLLDSLQTSEIVNLETSQGTVVVELDSKAAPVTAANFLSYVDSGLFNDSLFHHIVAGFVVQGGRYRERMLGIPTGAAIPNESLNGLANLRGTIAMARDANPHGATSQFVFNLADNRSLDARLHAPGYAVFGRIIRGLEVIDALGEAPVKRVGNHFSPTEPVRLLKARREISVSMEELVEEASAIQMERTKRVPARKKSTAKGEKGKPHPLTSTDRAFATVSQAFKKLTTSISKMTGAIQRK